MPCADPSSPIARRETRDTACIKFRWTHWRGLIPLHGADRTCHLARDMASAPHEIPHVFPAQLPCKTPSCNGLPKQPEVHEDDTDVVINVCYNTLSELLARPMYAQSSAPALAPLETSSTRSCASCDAARAVETAVSTLAFSAATT